MIHRRDFIKKGATGLAGLMIVPSLVMGKSAGANHKAPSDKLNIAAVGIGGMGAVNLKNMQAENIVALCDVDWGFAGRVFNTYPNAKRYTDYRKMFEEMGKSIDGVLVATPDHTHSVIAADAITLGKHVYVQKPLTHTVYESRLLTKLASKYNVATQMGNQGASGQGIRQICDWIWNGEIGEVRKVEAFTDRPGWPQGISRPLVEEVIPSTLDWNLFLGPAPYRPYNKAYTPGVWRGWWDFGTGALGDMACHILEPAFKALQLKYPSHVSGSSTTLMTETAPLAQMIKWVYPSRGKKEKVNFPEVEIIWYDGGLQPPRLKGMDQALDLNDYGGGMIFHGTKDSLICGCYGLNPWLLSGRKPEVRKICPDVPLYENWQVSDKSKAWDSGIHEQDWIRACKENALSRIKPSADFSLSGPFNEMIVMGVMAIRLQGLQKTLSWDGENMRFTNISDTETFSFIEEKHFVENGGRIMLQSKMGQPINAERFAQELIRHEYKNGYSLPEMPR